MSTIESRIQELIDADWRTVKAAAAAVGITEKPDWADSWNDVAYDIASQEAAQEAAPAPQKATPAPAKTPAIGGKYPTEIYRAIGVPVCPTCGADLRSNLKPGYLACPYGHYEQPN